jgi:threonine aldolase
MILASDNWAGASERVIEAIAEAARDGGPAYGGDPLTKAVEQRFCEVFEREVAVFFVATGTAANALGISTFARPGGVVFCHRMAHLHTEEAGATELFSGGMKTIGLDGRDGKLTPDVLAAAVERFPADSRHHGQPVAMSLSNLTEIGTAYGVGEVAALAEAAKRRGLIVHMDGARIANAVAGVGCSPAELTWRAGVDVLSFGATKNGCVAADAVVFFDPSAVRDFAYARQRAGHTFSKSWFVAAQFDAYLADDHWLDLARRANGSAARLAAALEASPSARLAIKPEGNEVFAILDRDLDARLREAGVVYHQWSDAALDEASRPAPGEVLVRLVASFSTSEAEIDEFTALLSG